MKELCDYIRSYCGKDEELSEILSVYNNAKVVEESDIKAWYPARARNTHKGSYGTACVVAGSEEYLGAAALSIATALKSGCGYVYAAVPQAFRYALAAKYPQCIYISTPRLSANAIAVGMGMGCNEGTYALVCSLLSGYEGKLIIDADGLNSLAKFGLDGLADTKAQILLTPHIGEMARLAALDAEEVKSHPVEIAAEFASRYGVTVHLKSAVSLTTDGINSVICTRGNTALAKAGSGDMLSGLICGNAARGLDLMQAAAAGQYALGIAAEEASKNIYQGAVTAAEIINNIGKNLP